MSYVVVWARGDHFVDEHGATLCLKPGGTLAEFVPVAGPVPEPAYTEALTRARATARHYHEEP